MPALNPADSLPLSSPRPGIGTRFALLAAIFVVELLTISVWLDGEMLLGAGSLASVLRDWGAFTLRLALASIVAFLVLGESRTSQEISSVSWPCLTVHASAMAGFAVLSGMVYGKHSSGMAANLEVLGWGAAGIAAIVSAACALIPAAIWIDRIRALGDLLLFAPAAGAAACVLGSVARELWPPLTHGTFTVVGLMLHPFLAQFFADPTAAEIGSPRFRVQIAPECSGYEGIGLIFAVTCSWLWFRRRECRFPQALLLIPAGVALVWILNAARIAALILIGNAGAEGIAMGGFHSQAGWIAFSLVAVGTCSAARRISWFGSCPRSSEITEPQTSDAVTANLVPFLAILAAALVSRAISADFEWLYGLRVAAAVLRCGISAADIAISIAEPVGWRWVPARSFSRCGLRSTG